MANKSHIISSTTLTFLSLLKPSTPPHPPSFLKLPATAVAASRIKLAPLTTVSLSASFTSTSTSNSSSASFSSTYFYGLCYVVRDDVDTDQIIPTQFSSLNPSNPEEYKELGSYALIGLSNSYPLRFVEDDGIKSKYSIIIAGNNFGCGRKHAAVDALIDAGTRAVVAESYDGVFLKNSNSSGMIFALESEVRICDEFKTGDVATIDVGERVLVNQTTGIVYQIKAVVDADVGSTSVS